MKNSIIGWLTIILLISCSREIEGSKDVPKLNLITVSGWPTLDFKEKYTIQVPSAFTGPGLEGFEGRSFYKSSPDHKIILYGGYGTALFVFDFGDTLQNPLPNSVQVINTQSNTITLDRVEYFYRDEELKGVLYFAQTNRSWGKLYWKDEGELRQALQIDFDLSELGTVNKIIQSIKPKSL